MSIKLLTQCPAHSGHRHIVSQAAVALGAQEEEVGETETCDWKKHLGP